MSSTSKFDDPKLQTKMEKAIRRDRYAEYILRRVLRVMEWCIAGITVIALVGALIMEIYLMFREGKVYFADISHMLHNLLAIVVGLEFVRMLIDTTPCQCFGSSDFGYYPLHRSQP